MVSTIAVYLHGAPENLRPELGLHAERVLGERWNGWLRPLATADSVGFFLDAWRRNDPNGEWGWATEAAGTLVVGRPDGGPPETFPRIGRGSSGAALYDLTGWVWVSDEESDNNTTVIGSE